MSALLKQRYERRGTDPLSPFALAKGDRAFRLSTEDHRVDLHLTAPARPERSNPDCVGAELPCFHKAAEV